MCGIAGGFAPGGSMSWGTEVVDAMCKAITHRGPDDQGIYAHASAHIGMRRLAIIDLHSGHQPIHNEDQSVWIVFNGEIYNYPELRAELQHQGHRFYTQTDTECIVHAYEQYGLDAFSRLRGMFAIAIVDLRSQQLVLTRDRLGKKPLYHTQLSDGTVAFGSELKCLLQIPGFRPAVSTQATRDFFALGYVPGPQSIYQGVFKLPPAHVMVVDASGEHRLQRYWQPSFGPKWTADEHTLRRQLLEHLEDAVRVRLVSDVPFGAFLSGGTDSSVVAALMARNMGQPLKTFSIGFREAAFNELPDARRVAQHIGADHHEFIVEAKAVGLLDKLVWHFDEPFADPSAIPTFLVSELASRQVKMVLSGDGGDELFAGYERYAKYHQLVRWREQSLGMGGPMLSAASHLLPGAIGVRVQRIAQRMQEPFPDDYLSGVGLARRGDLQKLLNLPPEELDPYQNVRAPYLEDLGGDGLDRLLWGDIKTYLLEDILVKVDRMTMAHSLEARSPLLDHQLLEFAARLPAELKLQGNQGKRLLKDVARQLLPPEYLQKPKQGFAIPLAQWMRGELLGMMRDLMASRSFRERGVYNVQGVQQCLQRHIQGVQDNGEMLWTVLNYELWAQRFCDAPMPARASA